MSDPLIRAGQPEDAAFIARMVNQASGGIALHMWAFLAGPGGDPWAMGHARAAGRESSISHDKAWIAEQDGQPVGCLCFHLRPPEPEVIPPDEDPMWIPLQELENLAPETCYVHILSTEPALQGKGIGTQLLRFADRHAGPNGMSIIVSDANTGARRLYERHGYRQSAQRPMVKGGWQGEGLNWLLLTKRLA